ncbi:DNA gyrase subunit A [Salinarchaeum chitinilyticum]
MSSDLPQEGDIEAADVETVRVEDEMEQSYIDYAMSVIAGRALPDVRDGLKPVHRRILFAMHEMGVTSNSGHRKCSSIVGETMGDYHPHGDSPIYDALVRMAQDFSMRYPLVDGQGNFGSMDGDPPAAMRYTEARMSEISEELLDDIGKDTVDFSSNYDDRLQEPEVLPAAFPNLLVNGASGIAVGMSTNVPPHNLGEVIDAVVHLIDNPDATVRDLMEHVPGPDFPTGANIVGRDAIYKAYSGGRGRLRLRAEYELQREENGKDRIVVTELPYQQNKARMVERIAEDVNEGTIEGISDLRDESDRDGVRVVVECKRGANVELVENQLLEHHLERTFSVILLALVDGQPQVLTLKQALQHYVDHRREVVRRRSEYDLEEAEHRAHILEGRLHALDNIDDVVELIRNSEDRSEAVEGLQEEFEFTEEQAMHVVRMQLGSLTSLEAQEIREEYEEVQAEIERLETILGDEDELMAVIKRELREVKDEYDDDRRTRIVEDDGTVTHEDLIPEEESVIVLTEEDYVKRMPAARFDDQRRGGKGVIGADVKEGDRVDRVVTANTHDTLLWFTESGEVYETRGFEIPEMGRTARGTAAVNFLDIEDDETIATVLAYDEIDTDQYVVTATREGYVKRTVATAFENVLSTGIIAADVDPDDAIVDAAMTTGDDDLLIASENGMAIRFPESDARAMGRSARGVGGIELVGDDAVAGITAISETDGELLTVTRNGYGKRTKLAEYRPQSRFGKGLVDIETVDRNGPTVAVEAVDADDHLVLYSREGQIMRTRAADVSVVGRNTMGVIVMGVEEGDEVADVAVLDVNDGDDDADDESEAEDETEADGGADDESAPSDEAADDAAPSEQDGAASDDASDE